MALIVRLSFIASAQLSFESDEAIVGLMARHVLYRGELPLFYYGQSYLGPLEALSAALSFAAFGPSVVALRLAPAIYSLAFVLATASFARRAFGEPASLACLIYLATPPLFLLTWSVKARGGYSEMIALGAIVLGLGLDIGDSKAAPLWKWLALGTAGGLAAWTDPLTVVYLLPAAIYLLLRLRGRLVGWGTLIGLAAFALTSGPMLIANVRSHGATFQELTGPNVSQAITLSEYRHNLSSVMRESVPTLLGFFQASSNLPAFATARARAPWPGGLLTGIEVVLVMAAVVLLLASVWRAARLRPGPTDLLVWVGTCTVLLFGASRVEVLYLTEPRYLLPLYALLPVAGRYWARLWSAQRAVALVALGMVVALNVSSIVRFDPSLSAPRLDGQIIKAGEPSLAAFLEARGVKGVYCDYWLAYPIAFQSGERVTPSVIDDQLRVGFNRYIPYAISVDNIPDPAVLVVAGSPTEARLESAFRVAGSSYRIGHWRNLDLFDHVEPPFRPPRA